jgi:hypothetical protein
MPNARAGSILSGDLSMVPSEEIISEEAMISQADQPSQPVRQVQYRRTSAPAQPTRGVARLPSANRWR